MVFSLLLGTVASGTLPALPDAGLLLLLREAGGIVLGLLLGWGTVRRLHSIDEYKMEALLTLAAVGGSYALASRLHISGPLAMVVAGLMVGNGGRARHCLHHAPRCGHVLEADGRHLERGAVCADWHGGAADCIHVPAFARGAWATVVSLVARALTVGLPVRLSQRFLVCHAVRRRC